MASEELSLTPPLSPTHCDLRKPVFLPVCNDYLKKQVPMFACSGNHTSYLKNLLFVKLLNSLLQDKNGRCEIVISGKTHYDRCNISKKTTTLFSKIRKNFSFIKEMSSNNCLRNSQSANDVVELRRKNCETFYRLISNLLMLQNIETELFIPIIQEVRNLLLFVGRLGSSLEKFKNSSSSTFHDYASQVMHACADIWWYSISTLYVIASVTNFKCSANELFCIDVPHYDCYLQVAALTVCDLICTSISSYKSGALDSTTNMCRCIQELWVMLIKLLDVNKENPFWSVYSSNIQTLMQQCLLSKPIDKKEVLIERFTLLPSDTKLDGDMFAESSLWHILQVCRLYKFNHSENLINLNSGKTRINVLKPLVIHLLASDMKNREKSLRASLFYCANIISILEDTYDILMPLTDHFVKHIEDRFSLSGIDMHSLNFLHASSGTWFQNLKNLTSSISSLEGCNSYEHFLHILHFQLKSNIVQGNLWRSLKGRIYSKLKKTKELSEVGQQNLFSLFLIIALSGQAEIAGKISELASTIDTTKNIRKITISWKALFTLIRIYETMNHNATEVVSRLSEYFNSTCSNYAISSDSMHKTSTMNLLLVYTDSMADVFENRQECNTCLHELICSGYATLLSSSGITEINYILGVFYNILVKVENHSTVLSNELFCRGVAEMFLKHIFPFIKDISTSNTPPSSVASIAVVLTSLLSKLLVSVGTPQTFDSLFLYFGCKDLVHPSITCQYVSSIMDDSELQQKLRVKFPDFACLVFQTWLRCTLFITRPDNTLNAFTMHVMQMNETSELFPGIKMLNTSGADHVFTSIIIYRYMGQALEGASQQHQAALKQSIMKYFRTLPLSIKALIQKQCNASTMAHLYKLTSHLVEYCSRLLHAKYNSESLLLEILNQTVFPYLIFPKDKASQSVLTCSIKDHLNGFLRGLLKLDYRTDRCIERLVKNVIVFYIGAYPTGKNPITKFLVHLVEESTPVNQSDVFEFVISIIQENVLLGSAYLPNGYDMCFELLRHCPSKLKPKLTNVIFKSSFEVYTKQTDSHTDYLRNFIRKMLLFFRDLRNSSNFLVSLLEWFIGEKLPWSSARGFSVMDLFVEIHPAVVSEIIPVLSKKVEEMESNRGFGEDVMLRSQLRNLIAKLQYKMT